MRIRVEDGESGFPGLEDFFLHEDLIHVEENLTSKQILDMLWNSILCRMSWAVERGDITLEDIYQNSSQTADKLIKDLAKLHDAE